MLKLKNYVQDTKKSLIRGLVKSVVKAIYLFGFTFKEFTDSCLKEIVSQGKNRKMSFVEMSNFTGVDRRVISKISNETCDINEYIPLRLLILSKLYERQHSINNGEPIFIEHFNKIIKDNKDGNIVTSADSFLKFLCSDEIGCAKHVGNYVDILSPCFNRVTDSDTLLEFFSSNTYEYICTLEHNFKNIDNKMFERTIRSTQIPIFYHIEANEKIYNICINARNEINTTLKYYEDPDANVGSFPAVGLHITQFSQQQKVQHEKSNNPNSIVVID